MGLFHGKRFFASSAQLISTQEANSPHNTSLDFNCKYLLEKQSITDWATEYLIYGKQALKRYGKYAERLDYTTRHYAGLDNVITCNPDRTYQIDDTLIDIVFSQLSLNKEEIKEFTVDVRNANYYEREYIACTLSGYNATDDTIIENGIVYYYNDYWFDDINTIRVYFVADDGSTLEKTIPAYKMHSYDPEVIAYDYLYVEVIYKETFNKRCWMLDLPVNGTDTVYKYGGYDFTKKTDTTLRINPLIPVKKGGYWGDFWDWNDYQLIAWRYKNDEDLTGAFHDASAKMKDKYTDNCSNLYKKCKYKKKIDTYKTYKRLAKKSGSSIEEKMSIMYNILCGFNSSITNTGDLRDQCYEIYDGWFCPIHAIRSDACNAKEAKSDFYNTVYKKLLEKYPNRPEIAQYAYYTYYSSDKFFS